MTWRRKHSGFLRQLKKRTRRLKNRVLRRWAYLLVLIPVVAEWLDRAQPTTEIWEIAKTLYRGSDELKRLSETDDLTGVFNRRRFIEDMEVETTRSKRLRIPLSLLYVDVDNFKTFNDTHGHALGDRILEEVAVFLGRSVRRRMDRCYRIGGDEFAVLMLGAHACDAVEAMKRRRDELAKDTLFERDGVRLSVGAVELNGDAPAELLKKADRCMYAAKRGETLPNGGKACFAKI
jgi:diguanylate cyclase (GGDEF)-like protein